MDKLFDIVLSIVEIIILIIGIIVFTGVYSITDSYIRFIFMFLDFYSCISLYNSIKELVSLFKNNKEVSVLEEVI